ncbi:MAG TPA: FAD-dependent oxidoreductase [bacterium]|nr:FAD-dependent oxidoreductase [bacterium]
MKKPKFVPEFADIPAARVKMPELEPEERRLNFKEVELGLTEELARREAARCLSCRRCIGCGLCLAECDQCAIVYDEADQMAELEADAIVFASEPEVFNAGRKRDLGYGEAWNVITSFEFERLASPTGPLGGLLVRPSDGEIPRRIAFIQCVGSRDEAIGANYCSVECCSRTIAQAWRAREAVGAVGSGAGRAAGGASMAGFEVWVFHRGMRPYGKTSEVELGGLARADWAKLIDATVASVKEDPATGALTVSYKADGEERRAAFDLVVLAVGVGARRDFRRHARLGAVAVNKYGFVDAGVASMVACKEGVAFAGPVRGPATAARSVIDAIAAASRALAASVDATGPGAGVPAGVPAGTAATPGSASASPAAKPVVFACAYGLEAAGADAPASLLEQIRSRGLAVGGSYPLLCYKEGRDAMKREVGPGSPLIVLGCHSGSHEMLFERALGLAPGAVSIISGAELAADPAAEPGQRPAPNVGYLVEAALATQPPAIPSDAPARPVAILGGGVSGLAAASELARRGLKVIVIEKSETLGANLAKATITGEPQDVKVIGDFVAGLEANPRVRFVRSATLAQATRIGDALELMVGTPDGNLTLETCALVIATGAGAFDPAGAGPGPGKYPGAITQADFRSSLTRGEAPWQKVVMVQCVGARDAEHPYCSRYCCREALINALAFKNLNPEAELTILHRGLRAFGLDEELASEAVERGIAFIEVESMPAMVAQASPSGHGQGTVKVTGISRAGKPFGIACDTVVLSVAHSRADIDSIARLVGAPLDRLGFIETANPLVAPFASTAEGVFVCGFARNPVTVEEAFAEGLGIAGAVCQYMGQHVAKGDALGTGSDHQAA